MKVKVFSLLLLLSVFLQSTNYAQKVIFYDDFEQDSILPNWHTYTSTTSGRVEVCTTTVMEGNRAIRLGSSTDNTYNLNQLDLTLDLSGKEEVFLDFLIYNNYEEAHEQDGIFFSDDGAHFIKVVDFDFDSWTPRIKGKMPSINLSRLAYAHRLMLSENFTIRFQQYDQHDFIGSENFCSGIYLDNIKVVSQPPSYASLPFRENFEDETWNTALTIGNAMMADSKAEVNLTGIVEVIHYDSIQGNVLSMGNIMDKQYHTNALDLHLNLAGQSNAMLSFMMYDHQDETHEQDGIFFSDDGGLRFTKVYDFDPESWPDKIFGKLPPLHIDQLARQHNLQLTEKFVIRFQQYDDDDFLGSHFLSDGIMLDDIVVQAIPPVYAALPFEENFEGDSLAQSWRWGDPQSSDITGEITPNGVVEVVSFDDDCGKVIRLGNLIDNTYSTNALDFYIDLAGQHQAELSFWIYDHYDETHEQDGIFFSNNGGKSFTKVFDFDGDRWSDQYFGKVYALPIKRLAAAKGISLTSQFVIRFQQYGNSDFEGTRTMCDGIYLDNIIIKNPEVQYSAIPLVENFENNLSHCWKISNAFLTTSDRPATPDGHVGVVDSLSHSGQYALAMGKLHEGIPVVNALDLHLQLARQKDVQLSFWLYNNLDELDAEDGIWFSQDGGITFIKGYEYEFKLNSNEKYVSYSLNLDSLISSLGLRYTDQFMIRFQQSSKHALSGESYLKGGIFLDDIIITNDSLPASVSSDPTPRELN